MQNNYQIRNKTRRILQTVSLLLIIFCINACVAAKAKKCNCPTFGVTNKHSQLNWSNHLSASAANIHACQNNK